MKKSLFLLLFCGCSHRLALVYESGEATTMGTQFLMQSPKTQTGLKVMTPEIKTNENISFKSTRFVPVGHEFE